MLIAVTLWAALDLFGSGVATPLAVAPTPSWVATLRDGERVIVVERASTDPTRVQLSWPDGRTAVASVGADAIVHSETPAALASLGLVVEPLFVHAGLYRVRSNDPREDGLALAARLAGQLEIFPDFAFARTRFAIDIPPDDPRHAGQWYLDTIDIHAAWRIESGNAGVVIGVVDDGCDLSHPDLAAHMQPGRDLVDDDDDPSYAPDLRGNEHGTACAGLIAAVGDNGVGIAGACPECHLRCVRLLPGAIGGEVAISSDIEAYAQQLEWNVAVSSNSWGFVDHFPVPNTLARAIRTLIEDGRDGLGAVVLFAVGNDSREVKSDELYGIEGVVAVGAINAFDELASFSNSGKPVDLVAPAGTLTTDIAGPDGADEGDYTGLFGGTSSACPVAAGVAALLVAHYPDASALEIEAALVASTRPAPFAVPDANGHDLQYGYGIIDPAAALRLMAPPVPVDASEPVEVTPEEVVEPEVVESTIVEAAEVEAAEQGEPSAELPTDCRAGGVSWLALVLALLLSRGRSRCTSR